MYTYEDQTVHGSKTKFVTNEFSNGGNTGRRYFREIISRCVPGSKYGLLTDKGTRTYTRYSTGR